MAKKFVPGQMGLFIPESNWVRPAELPDLRRVKVMAIDSELYDHGLQTNLGPGWPFGATRAGERNKGGYLCGVSWAAEGSSGYAPIYHPDSASDCFDEKNVLRWLNDHFRAGVKIVFHNGNYDVGWFGTYGIEPPLNMEDTLPACVMLDESKRSYSLDSCCEREGIPGKDIELLRDAVKAYGGKGAKPQAEIYLVPARYAGPYAEQDAVATLNLWHKCEPQLHAQNLWNAYRTEIELIPMVIAMRRRGIRLDTNRVIEIREEFIARRNVALDKLTDRIKQGRQVTIEDVRSPQWCTRVFKSENLVPPRTPPSKMYPNGQESFSADWMENHEHWLPRLVTEAKKYEDAASKHVGTFLSGFSHLGRIHPEIHQFLSEEGGTRSHRFSYSDPPLQQMYSPDKDPRSDLPDEVGKKPGWGKGKGPIIMERAIGTLIRSCFLPEKGDYWAALDFCHDDQTDILTARGWVPFAELQDDEPVAQWHMTGEIEFVTPTEVYRGPPAQRKMIHLNTPHQIDLCVTENHRCLLIHGSGNRQKKTPLVIPANELKNHLDNNHQLIQAGILRQGYDEDPDIIWLIVTLHANAAYRGGTWGFHLVEISKIKRLVYVLTRLDLIYFVSPKAKNNQTIIVIYDKDPRLSRYLKNGKTFVVSALLALSEASRRLFLNELSHWDGYTRDLYRSTNKECVNAVQAVAVTLGHRTRMLEYRSKFDSTRKTVYSLCFSKRDRSDLNEKNCILETLEMNGPVYCATVPSGFLVTRRAGRVTVSGNSSQEPRITVHFAAKTGCRGAEEAVAKYNENPRMDYHQMVADMVDKPRPVAKILNLAMTYGKGKVSLAEELGVSLEEAEEILRDYHSRLPYIKALEDECKRLATARGFIRLIDGARMHYSQWEAGWLNWEVRRDAQARGLPLGPCSLAEAVRRQADPDHPWSLTRLRRADTRKALNNLVQGSAARQTKLAMLAMWREGIIPLIQLHDELGLSANTKAQVDRAEQIMIETTPLLVPTVVDAEIGDSWGTAKHTWEEAVAKYGRAV